MTIDPSKIEKLIKTIENERGTGDNELILRRREQQFAFWVENRRRSLRFKPVHRVTVAAIVCLAVAAGVIIHGRLSPSKSALFQYTVYNAESTDGDNQWILSAGTDNTEIRFQQGSRFAINNDGAVRILSHTRKLVHLELHAGQMEATVNGNGVTTWKISAGPFELSVLGTRFEVDWNLLDTQLHVRIKQGVVWVQGGSLDNHGIHLYKGQTLVAGGRNGTVQVATEAHVTDVSDTTHVSDTRVAPSLSTDDAMNTAPSQSSTDTDSPDSINNIPRTPRWLVHYRNDDFHLAAKAIRATGLPALLQTASVTDLWRISQVFRNVEDIASTNMVLLRIRSRFPASSKASLAAFMVGRNFMEYQHDPHKAAVWFERYIEEAPNGAMIQEAFNRLLLSYSASGRSQRAKEVAGTYLNKFPHGVYVSKAKQLYQ